MEPRSPKPFTIAGMGSTIVYFIGPDGERWVVGDVTISDGQVYRSPLGHARARARVFVAGSGQRRIYRFAAIEERVVTADALERQFRAGLDIPPDAPNLTLV